MIKAWLERVESKLDRMEARSDQRHDRLHDRLNDVDAILVRQNIVLEDHTRRSLANEEAVAMLREQISARNRPPRSRLTPALIGKAAAGAGALGAAVVGALKALGVV